MKCERFLVKEWLPAIRSTVRTTTYVGYESHVRLHICPYIGRLDLTSVDAARLNTLYARLLAHGRANGRGLSPATVRRVHATLHRALRDATRWGYLSDNPANRCDPPKKRADSVTEMRIWSPQQIAAFLRSVRSDRCYELWLVLAMTGLRRGEALGIRWSDIDLRRREIAVRQTVLWVSGRIEISRPKTARGRRVVALDPATARVIKGLRSRGASDDALVFCNDDGSPLNPNEVTKRFGTLVRRSGLPRIRLHDLRHTHATIALQAGVHPKIVSERLGHSTIAFTLDVYSHSLPHLQKEAATLVARLINR